MLSHCSRYFSDVRQHGWFHQTVAEAQQSHRNEHFCDGWSENEHCPCYQMRYIHHVHGTLSTQWPCQYTRKDGSNGLHDQCYAACQVIRNSWEFTCCVVQFHTATYLTTKPVLHLHANIHGDCVRGRHQSTLVSQLLKMIWPNRGPASTNSSPLTRLSASVRNQIWWYINIMSKIDSRGAEHDYFHVIKYW